MQAGDVTEVGPEVVEEVLADPATFLAAAAEARPGWSQRYGGPLGAAQLATVLQEQLTAMAVECSDIRISAVRHLRASSQTLASIGTGLGITPQSVKRLAERPVSERPLAMRLRPDSPAWE